MLKKSHLAMASNLHGMFVVVSEAIRWQEIFRFENNQLCFYETLSNAGGGDNKNKHDIEHTNKYGISTSSK